MNFTGSTEEGANCQKTESDIGQCCAMQIDLRVDKNQQLLYLNVCYQNG